MFIGPHARTRPRPLSARSFATLLMTALALGLCPFAFGQDARIQGNALSASFVRLPDEGAMPSFNGAIQWLNSTPLTAESLRGKVVLVEFWTYSCINCLHTLPYVKAWAEKYSKQGLVVVGVHTPEFPFEGDVGNVKKVISDLGIKHPVVLDNDYAIWRSFRNRYWPAHYFVDARGRIRFHHFGEGAYAESERVIQQLLREANTKDAATAPTDGRGGNG